MHIKDNPDFKTVWQLAHDLADEESDKTDPNAISPRLSFHLFLISSMSYGFICSSYKQYQQELPG